MAKTAQISDEAVESKTGMSWTRWCRLLDKAGGRDMTHKEIVAHIAKKHPDLGGWWTQMVAVGYEQARGLRQRHQKPDGFEISVTRTVAAPLADLYRAFADKRRRDRWLAAPAGSRSADLQVRKATRDRSLRASWVDGRTRLEVSFCAKGEGRSQVAVQHGKLSGAREAQRQKAYWARQLGALKAYLEG